jgi:hypothetical protein
VTGHEDRAVVLKPAESDDLALLYRLAVEEPHLWPRLCERASPPPHRFADLLWSDTEAVFVATNNALSDFYGVCSIYAADHRNQVAYVEFVFLPTVPGLVEAQAAVLLIQHAFRHWRFRKLYTTYCDFTANPVSRLSEVTTVEGTLRNYTYHNGMYWDQTVIAIERSDWIGGRTAMLSKLQIEPS